MLLDTARFGRIDVDPNKSLRFVTPILGFAGFEEFVLLEHPSTEPIRWLQSTESDRLAFPVIDPFLLLPDYDVAVSPSLLDELQTDTLDDLCTLTIVVVAKDVRDIRTNLRAPVIYNPKTCLAKQIVLEDTDYPVQHFLAQDRREARESETVNAGA